MKDKKDWIYSLFFYGIIIIAVGLGSILSTLLNWKIIDGIIYLTFGFLMLIGFIICENLNIIEKEVKNKWKKK